MIADSVTYHVDITRVKREMNEEEAQQSHNKTRKASDSRWTGYDQSQRNKKRCTKSIFVIMFERAYLQTGFGEVEKLDAFLTPERRHLLRTAYNLAEVMA